MSATIASRELRNHTAEVLSRVEAGAHLTITTNGRPVAELVPLTSRRRPSLTRAELVFLLETQLADPGLRDDLVRLAGDMTDDLGSIE